MPRRALSDEQRRQGRELGRRLKLLRGDRTSEEMAQAARVRVDTLRSIEAGRVSAPGFFLVGQIVEAAGGRLDALWTDTTAVAGDGDRA